MVGRRRESGIDLKSTKQDRRRQRTAWAWEEVAKGCKEQENGPGLGVGSLCTTQSEIEYKYLGCVSVRYQETERVSGRSVSRKKKKTNNYYEWLDCIGNEMQ